MVFPSELVKLRDGQLGWSIVIVDQTERDAKAMAPFGEAERDDFEGFGLLGIFIPGPCQGRRQAPP
jgi:hypothetical protein